MATSNKKWSFPSFAEFVFEEEDQTFVPDAGTAQDQTENATPAASDQTETKPEGQTEEQPTTDQTTDEKPAENTEQPAATTDSGSKGADAAGIVSQLKNLVEVTNDQLSIGAPSDIHGNSTSYGNIEKAIQKIEDIAHYYAKKDEPVSFYCWNLNWTDWKSGQAVENKFKEAGVSFEKFKFVDLTTLIKYFESNPDDAGLLKSVSLSLDSKGQKEFADSMAKGDQGSLD